MFSTFVGLGRLISCQRPEFSTMTEGIKVFFLALPMGQVLQSYEERLTFAGGIFCEHITDRNPSNYCCSGCRHSRTLLFRQEDAEEAGAAGGSRSGIQAARHHADHRQEENAPEGSGSSAGSY